MRSSTIWGSLFIILGIILLFIMYSVIPFDILAEIGKLWPLIFIAIGIVVLIFSRSESKIEKVKK